MTFYDGVHVDDEWRVGEVDGGWQVMLVALSFERGVAGGVRDAERLLAVAEAHARDAVDDDGRPLLDDADRRDALARLAIDAEVTDLLASRAAWVAASGRLPGVEGAASKLFATEAFQRVGRPPGRRRRARRARAVARRDRPRARSTSTATASRPSPPSTAAPARSSATSSPSAGSACRAAADRPRSCAGCPASRLAPEAGRVPRRGAGASSAGALPAGRPAPARLHRPHRLGRGVRA